MRALIIEHDHVSPPGPVGDRLQHHGFEIVEHLVVDEASFHAPAVTTDFPDPRDFDVIVPMGAPWSAYDDDSVGSWVLPELEMLRRAHEHDIPVLGICFGGQLLAMAHGGHVTRSGVPEIGWVDIVSDDDLVPAGPWFQWHYDRWQLPPDAREIARNAAASQAFVLGRNLALQFHPELTPGMLQGWLDNGGAAKAVEYGEDPAVLLERTVARQAESLARTNALVDTFVSRMVRSRR